MEQVNNQLPNFYRTIKQRLLTGIFYAFGLLMMAFAIIFGHKAMNGDGQVIGNIVLSFLVTLGSILILV
jgi:hypothetical protein